MHDRIAVVGGCNIDLSATAFTPLISKDSNPGFLKTTMGGVGRNIAENLSRLGYEVHLISMLGNDHFKQAIETDAQSFGLDLSYCETVDDANTSTYLCINQPDGDISVAVSAMEICDRLTPEVLEKKLDFLNSCHYVVLDSNIPVETIIYLKEHCTAKLCADAVSSKKAAKLRSVLPSLFFLKANRSEAEILSGIRLDDLAAVNAAIDMLHHSGVKNVAITLSMDGAYFSDGHSRALLPPLPIHAVNTTGCGDAFFAGVLTALINELDVSNALRRGLAMAAISAEANNAVSPTLTADKLKATLSLF